MSLNFIITTRLTCLFITPNIQNHNTRCTTDIYRYSFRTKHEFAKRYLRYNLPHIIINNTLNIFTEKIGTHSLQGFANYGKNYLLQKYEDTYSILNCYTSYQNRLNQ